MAEEKTGKDGNIDGIMEIRTNCSRGYESRETLDVGFLLTFKNWDYYEDGIQYLNLLPISKILDHYHQ
jgi:hypothetical protein